AIARCRRQCWEIEHQVCGEGIGGAPFMPRSGVVAVPDPNALVQLRTMKTLLGLLVEGRPPTSGRPPPGAAGWADNWERHRWVPTDAAGPGNTPWDRFAGKAGVVEAGTRQNAIVAKAPDQAEVYLVNPLRHWITTPDVLMQFGGWPVVTE